MTEGWKFLKFSEICELKKGKKPNLLAAMNADSQPYLSAKYLRGADPIEFAAVSDKNSVSVSSNEIIIICDGSNSGETFIGFDGILSSTMAKVIHGQDLQNGFLLYFLASLSEKFSAGKTGSAIPHLDLPGLRNELIPVPPIAEQHRIVAILDEAFDGIATAKANAEKNLRNARAIFSTSLNNQLTELQNSCFLAKLGDVCKFENGDRGKNYPGKDHRSAEGIPFINAGHLTENGINFSEMDYITEERFDLLGNGKIKNDDILFCLRGSLGKFASVGKMDSGAIASSLVILRPNMNLNPDYLLLYLESSHCADMIEAFKGGAAQPNLGAKDLKKFLIPTPSIDVQGSIVKRLTEVKRESQNLRAIYARKTIALDDLKKSLLAQAFSGAL